MGEAPLSERLDHAILEIVCRNRSEATHQDYWGGWRNTVQRRVPEFVDAELVSAFRRLWKRGVLRLTKPDSSRYHAHEYSGRESEDGLFFMSGSFNASITDEGRSHWDSTQSPKTTLFISHIVEEKAVALKLQTLIQSAFGKAFPVFVSSDPDSLGGGEEWYHHILDNLAKAKVVLVLLSAESADRPWINFEAGIAKGQRSIVLPVAFRGMSFDALDYPLKGLQGYYLPALKEILTELSKHMGAPLGEVVFAAEWEEINDIQIELPAKKLAVEMHLTPGYLKCACHFSIVNNGNRNVEPLEVTISVPTAILASAYQATIDPAILEARVEDIGGVQYTSITYRNHREPLRVDRFSNPERLVKCLTPGMSAEFRHLSFDVRYPLDDADLQNPIRYRILANDVRPVERTITLKDKLAAPKK